MEPANRQFLIEYYGEGESSNVDCFSEVDADNMASCDAEFFSCKCKDSRNNTYNCLRTLFDEVEEENTIFCLFEVGLETQLMKSKRLNISCFPRMMRALWNFMT